MEGDQGLFAFGGANSIFQSTPSAWRETPLLCNSSIAFVISIHSLRMEGDVTDAVAKNQMLISIHSLRMEGDVGLNAFLPVCSYFNPLPPHGGRRIHQGIDPQRYYFNPLPPHGGRRPQAPQWGATEKFQSTPSAWRETCQFNSILYIGVFQSTPSAWRETIHIWKYFRCPLHFNPLPPHGGRLI